MYRCRPSCVFLWYLRDFFYDGQVVSGSSIRYDQGWIRSPSVVETSLGDGEYYVPVDMARLEGSSRIRTHGPNVRF